MVQSTALPSEQWPSCREPRQPFRRQTQPRGWDLPVRQGRGENRLAETRAWAQTLPCGPALESAGENPSFVFDVLGQMATDGPAWGGGAGRQQDGLSGKRPARPTKAAEEAGSGARLSRPRAKTGRSGQKWALHTPRPRPTRRNPQHDAVTAALGHSQAAQRWSKGSCFQASRSAGPRRPEGSPAQHADAPHAPTPSARSHLGDPGGGSALASWSLAQCPR